MSKVGLMNVRGRRHKVKIREKSQLTGNIILGSLILICSYILL